MGRRAWRNSVTTSAHRTPPLVHPPYTPISACQRREGHAKRGIVRTRSRCASVSCGRTPSTSSAVDSSRTKGSPTPEGSWRSGSAKSSESATASSARPARSSTSSNGRSGGSSTSSPTEVARQDWPTSSEASRTKPSRSKQERPRSPNSPSRPSRCPRPTTSWEMVFDLEKRLFADPTQGREELRRIFRGRPHHARPRAGCLLRRPERNSAVGALNANALRGRGPGRAVPALSCAGRI